jgi:hypothetical protein
MNYGLKQAVATFFLALVMVGCAGSGVGSKATTAPIEAKEVVADLAAARWNALIQGDLAKAYTYLSPATRSIMSLDAYKNKIRPGKWKKAKVDSVSCEQDVCKVTMVIEYSYRDMNSIETRLDEAWLQEDGKWWYVLRK